ncbi:MAG TPA: PaaI family thioesterase [Gemmatimonadaceae bacterium]|nr:PaaI family thioesterase [Gemmatimonadaceae bacterium]
MTARAETARDIVRERIVRWADPLAAARAGRSLGGLEHLQAIQSGTSPPPPILALIGATMGTLERGRVTMDLTPAEYHYNPYGTVHGGVLATLLDTVMSCAILSQQPVGRGNTTIDLTINYVRAVSIDSGTVTAEGTVVHAGRSTALAQGRLVDAKGRLYAVATTTCLLLDLPPAP